MRDAPSNIPLTSAAAWEGLWVRSRSGPKRSNPSEPVEVTVWHRIGSIDNDAFHRIRTVCRRGPRYGITWPSGGHRLEIARPVPFMSLPGAVCSACRSPSVDVIHSEQEVLLPDETDIETLADLVSERLLKRREEGA